jgi:DNA repair protein RadC
MTETLKIKDMPQDARPREAFMRSAAPDRDIPDASLLAILVRTGRKGSSALDIAHRLINHFGSAANLVDATWQQIVAAKVPGVGKVAAVQLAAAFALVKRNARVSHRSFARAVETPDDVVRQVRSVGIDETQECAYALFLDAKRHLLCEPAIVSRGTADKTFIHPRDIFRQAVRLGAVSVIVAHNHPSGDPTPSDEDISETKRLAAAGDVVGIPLDDHVVIGRAGAHVSIMALISEELQT